MPLPWERYQNDGPWQKYESQTTEEAPDPQPKRSLNPFSKDQLQQLAQDFRPVTLGARGIMEGGMDIVSPFADALALPLNAALPGQPFPARHSESFSNLLTSAGVPAPQGTAENLSNLATRFITGMAAGGAIDKAVLGGMGLAPTGATASRAAPTTEELKQLSREAYQQAEKAGVVISPSSFSSNVDDLVKTVASEGIDSTLHPQATAALKRLTDAAKSGEPITLQQLETLRKVVKASAGSLSRDERRIARIMVDSLDDYALNLGASDVVAGSANNVGQVLRNARDLWARASKGEVVDDLIERAQNRASQFSGSGYENALRTEFRSLIQNPRRLRLFTPAEQQALKTVARGGPIENVLRYFGKLAPTGVVSTALGGGLGAVAAGAPGAVGVPLAGAMARQGATQLTARNARLAAELMRRGGPAAASQVPRTIAPYLLGSTPSLYNFLFNESERR
jgi:hypothetical protein